MLPPPGVWVAGETGLEDREPINPLAEGRDESRGGGADLPTCVPGPGSVDSENERGIASGDVGVRAEGPLLVNKMEADEGSRLVFVSPNPGRTGEVDILDPSRTRLLVVVGGGIEAPDTERERGDGACGACCVVVGGWSGTLLNLEALRGLVVGFSVGVVGSCVVVVKVAPGAISRALPLLTAEGVDTGESSGNDAGRASGGAGVGEPVDEDSVVGEEPAEPAADAETEVVGSGNRESWSGTPNDDTEPGEPAS
jgi:hypothetical protein